ncbi:MAG TPA: tetratricopeptide repeat protein [Bryobacteraceae bacterium]|jgi:tetratricopeptide (TPR) repeat protein
MLRIRLALIFVLSLTAGAADQPWTHLESEHFEIYTTASEKRARDTILYFEQVRALFAKLFPSVKASKMPVRIIAFRNEKEFSPFRPGQAAAAYYSPGIERDYIVMQSIASENYPIAVHEYMHRVVHGMGLELPVWLNEGTAELFATLQPIGNKVQMGQMDGNRATVLRTNRMIPFAQFLAVDQNSPAYNERDKAGIFYAQSFALAHMLFYGEGYRGKFGNLQLAFQKSKDPVEVFNATYGKSIETVQRELEVYMRQDRFFYNLMDVKLEKSASTVESLPVDDYESKVLRAEVYRVVKKWDESARLYEEASHESPERPDAEEGLAWVAMYQNKHAEALPHFVRAIELGSKDVFVYEHAARLGRQDSKRALGYMQRAVALDPELKDGNYNLGAIALEAQQPQVALDAFNKITKVTPDRAAELFRAKAHAYIGLGNYVLARKSAELSKQWANTDQDRLSVRDLISYLDQRDLLASVPAQAADAGQRPPLVRNEAPIARMSHPMVPVEPRKTVSGSLIDVACQGKQARLTVAGETGSKSVFLITDPDSVSIKNAEGITHEFTCGAQHDTRVKIDYAEFANTPAGIAGVVRTIEFVK